MSCGVIYGNQMNEIELTINNKPSFTEVWYEGKVVFKGKEYKFWLIDPQGEDENGNSYYYDIRWFFKQVPMEVRMSQDVIIKAFQQMQNKSPLN